MMISCWGVNELELPSPHPSLDGPGARPVCSAAEQVAAIPQILHGHREHGISRT